MPQPATHPTSPHLTGAKPFIVFLPLPRSPAAGGKLQLEVEEMLKLGVIEPSNSEWCSPLVIVFKKDGSLRICIDFRKLNTISEFDAYPMPRIENLLEKIGAAKCITTLDLCKGYWQVQLEESNQHYTAFRNPAGLYQFTVMPFGLHGGPATFQRLMNQVLQGYDNYSAAYLDEVVIFSNTWAEHVQHLSFVLGKIHKAELTLNPAKCEWTRQETQYLGYQLGQGEIRPQVDKVEAIQNCPRPRTKKEVWSCETRYSAVVKEGLAIKWALESLCYYLQGCKFDLETDHRVLIWINSMKDHKSRLTRWYLSL